VQGRRRFNLDFGPNRAAHATSRPAIAGRLDRTKCGERGAGLNAPQDSLLHVNIRSSFCNDNEAPSQKPHPPLSWGRINTTVLAMRAPSPRPRGEVNAKPSHSRTRLCLRGTRSQSREARSGSRRNREGWLASVSLSAFSVSPKIKRIWNAGRRRADLRTLGCGAVPWGTARLPAHHGSSQGVCGPLVRSGPGFVGKPSKGRGSLRRRPDHFQRRTSHAGRNAGRHDARTARERVASPPAGSASRPAAAVCSAAASFTGEMIRTICNRKRD
jgi:hypothetical protein